MTTPVLLPPVTATELSRAPFSYPEVGATRSGPLPTGYRQLRREVILGPDPTGEDRFVRVAEALLGWRMHSAAGLQMRVSALRAEPEVVLIATLALGPFPVRTRCRVVYLIDEPDAVGFAYGTLPGHPERGEERFLVERLDGDSVRFSLTAFSRLSSPLARLGGPISRAVQSRVNTRYLRTVRAL
ncbi:DUF1990 family protein [Microlunatus soli]|uniref:Uncharacterized protein, UPF0548 family n=1 Tax=Microlunatus soli TaxID=630515 RepID=A0A1H1UHC6_9ACTN|nr:DUF1990 domain-containing protein [Microlunatus soli]SDS71915.1 Uncharacterized protein, UPF0548 family [Microlunatus soli]